MDEPFRIALCGHSRCGKDETALWLRRHTPLRFTRSSSEVLCLEVLKLRYALTDDDLRRPEFADLIDVTFQQRHREKEHWFRVGNFRRDGNPGFFVDRLIDDPEFPNDAIVGLRNGREIAYGLERGRFAVALWIDRDVPPDPTLEYGRDACTHAIDNNGTLADLHRTLFQFCIARGIAVRAPAAALEPARPVAGR